MKCIDLQYSKRFRRPKTYKYWGERDGLYLGKYGRQNQPMWWHFFANGDVVEFKNPKNGELIQRPIIIEIESHQEQDGWHVVDCLDYRAYVKIGNKKVRVTEAPIMRLVKPE